MRDIAGGWIARVAAVSGALAAAAVLCAGGVDARAQTVRYVDDNAPGPVHDGATWCTALTSLQTALSAALAGDEIRVAGGVYKPTSGADRNKSFDLLNGVAIRGGYAGCGALDPDARDFTAHPSLLTGDLMGDDAPGFINDSENSRSVVRVLAGVTRSAVLDGFIIEGGNANGSNPRDRGGGIFMFNFGEGQPPSPTIRNCILRRNRALTLSGAPEPAKGGAVYLDNGSPLFQDCLFVGNRAPTGGAMFNFGTMSAPVLERCTVAYNSAEAHGGGIWNAGASTTVTDSILWGNSDPGGQSESAQFHAGTGAHSIDFSIVQGWMGGAVPGADTSGDDPLFRDPDGADGLIGTDDDNFRLDPASPAINTGDPTTSPAPDAIDVGGDSRLVGCRVDRGAYESSVAQLFGDFDGDDDVDLRDLAAHQVCLDSAGSLPALARACLCTFDDDADEMIDLNDFPALVSAVGP